MVALSSNGALFYFTGINLEKLRAAIAACDMVAAGAVKKAIKVMEERAKDSRWNYANKLHLLEAESFSSNGHNTLAIKSYKAAIEASKSSRFIHEQGLACELAAIHCKKVKDLVTSLTYFREAKACYEQWGSQPKVDAMIQQIDIIIQQQGT